MATPVTLYVETPDALIAHTETLIASANYTVRRISEADTSELDEILSNAELPAAVVIWSGAKFGEDPRAGHDIAIVARMAEGDPETKATAGRTQAWALVKALDTQILNQARWTVKSLTPIDAPGGGIDYLLRFLIEDH
ncbi:MAG: hypothetical protein GY851_35730 [bacterium]|nr:hypothetical protein [bacterium]